MFSRLLDKFLGKSLVYREKNRTFAVEYQLDGRSCFAVIEVAENQKISKNFFHMHLSSLIYHTPHDDSQVRVLAPQKVTKVIIFITSVKEIK